MRQDFTVCDNDTAGDGTPFGGRVHAVGLDICWQQGALGQGDERRAPNGVFVETVIAAAKQRLEHYQSTSFACAENADAIAYLEAALERLADRTARREAAGTEGTHQGS